MEQAAVSPELSNTERSMGEDYAADQPPTAARRAAEIANRTVDAGSLPQGVPPNHEWQRRRYDQGPTATSKNTAGDEVDKPRGTNTSLELGASLRVTGQEAHEELGDAGVKQGKQKLTLSPEKLHETFQPLAGRPQTLLARDRQVAGLMAAQAASNSVYRQGQGYTLTGAPRDFSTTNGDSNPNFSKEDCEWATSNRLVPGPPRRSVIG